MTIGTLLSMSLLYRVSRDDRLVRSCLTKRPEDVVIGKNRVALELRFSAGVTVRHFTTKHLSELTMQCPHRRNRYVRRSKNLKD